MKKFLAFIVAFVLTFSVMPGFDTSAETLTYGDLKYIVADGKITITECNSSATFVEIPAEINEYPVTAIRNEAFFGCSNLISVIIGKNVATIGDMVFRYCSNLTSVTIPESITTIGESAFSYCTNLTSVHITDMIAWCNIEFCDNSANPLSCGADLYLNNNLITKLGIPKGVIAIKPYAFYNCHSITSVVISDSVTTIGSYAFWGCSGMTSVSIPEGITTIGDSVFYDCDRLISITIPNSVTVIGDQVLENCANLTSVIIGNGVSSIGKYAFSGCDKLTAIIIPDTVCTIGDFAFYDCKGLTTASIGNGVIAIGRSVFENCTNLTSVTIGNNVSTIDIRAFAWCSRLTSLTIGDGVTTISDKAFYGCTSLTLVTVPHAVTSIRTDAFYYAPVTLEVHEDSYAYNYARKNDISYKLIIHTYVSTLIVPSTCIVAGFKSGICSVCDMEYTEILSLANHTPNGEPTVTPATCIVEGLETNHCSVCDEDYTVVLPIVEHAFKGGICIVCGAPDFQSEHPYADDMDQTWSHTVKDAESISITFSADTAVEENIDYIYIYDQNDNEIGYYTGSQLADYTVTVPGNTIKIRLKSDSSGTAYGFRVTKLEATMPRNLVQAVLIMQNLIGMSTAENAVELDQNGDGILSIADAVQLLRVLNGSL